MSLSSIATELGALLEKKNVAYGDSAAKAGKILSVLYGDGVRPDQYDDMLLMVRVLDKLSRISQRGRDGVDKGGESPWLDIAGYGVLGVHKDTTKPPPSAHPCPCHVSASGKITICEEHDQAWARELEEIRRVK